MREFRRPYGPKNKILIEGALFFEKEAGRDRFFFRTPKHVPPPAMPPIQRSCLIGFNAVLAYITKTRRLKDPQLLSKGNIVIIRNRKRAFLLCACSAVLIYLYLDLR